MGIEIGLIGLENGMMRLRIVQHKTGLYTIEEKRRWWFGWCALPHHPEIRTTLERETMDVWYYNRLEEAEKKALNYYHHRVNAPRRQVVRYIPKS